MTRGWKVNERIRPDAEMTLEGRKFFAELDTGQENHTRVSERQRAYSGVTDFLLFVTLTHRRMAGLIARAERVRDIALFTTLRQSMDDPRGEIWTDAFGNKAGI